MKNSCTLAWDGFSDRKGVPVEAGFLVLDTAYSVSKEGF